MNYNVSRIFFQKRIKIPKGMKTSRFLNALIKAWLPLSPLTLSMKFSFFSLSAHCFLTILTLVTIIAKVLRGRRKAPTENTTKLKKIR